MASLTDPPELGHSLWLQLRSTRRKTRRPHWRSDWAPVWILLILMSILTLFSLLMPSHEVVESAKQAVQNGAVDQQPPVVGALAEPKGN
jgi:hypothetical protein